LFCLNQIGVHDNQLMLLPHNELRPQVQWVTPLFATHRVYLVWSSCAVEDVGASARLFYKLLERPTTYVCAYLRKLQRIYENACARQESIYSNIHCSQL